MPKLVTSRSGTGKSECQKPFRRGNRSGVSLAPEQTLTGEGQRHMAQPQHPFSGRRQQARWGNGNRDGAPGTGSPGSGEWKAWAEVIAEWMFAKVNGVGPPASFQQEALQ